MTGKIADVSHENSACWRYLVEKDGLFQVSFSSFFLCKSLKIKIYVHLIVAVVWFEGIFYVIILVS